ncbi:isoleucyl-tRNA synthetase [Balneicella halophila]|uniref:Isoleucine--tRNA ligase n=1 Tax=Balneicella halophila TaxID=1537566 RepID=A0A7L4US35_BALHA|nr:isoleucine--tRNA ligase [Balneicella halophila]PVX52231.1 isoleucyl-tRNA synthetase [Balneicella halophila]
MKFPEYKKFNLSNVAKEVLEQWKTENTFEKSLENNKGAKEFVFYDGPPSANGMPGIHHVISRSLKDIVCRYKTLQGFHVERKAGWDTHGLPVELGVEKALGITKDDIGESISIEDYNKECRTSVMKYTDSWKELTEQMGYWADMDNPYITYDNKYIETLWWLLKQLFEKGYLYKGFSIQPYSPTDGTGLSSHELNLPGCYKDVKDTTIVAQFKIVKDAISEKFFSDVDTDLHFIAWTTTPWTLPSNTALAVGPKIDYVKIRTFNPYTGEPTTIICAKALYQNYFRKEDAELSLTEYEKGGKALPYKILDTFKGAELEGVRYEQLMPYQQPLVGDAFRVLVADFVTTEDGTGVVHIAPSFGADDYRVAQQNGIGALTLVNKQGKFIEGTGDLEGRYVKNDYDSELTDKDETVDVYIAVKLKNEGKAFKIEKYVHSYPHSWRTDKPILYYPLDSWFIKTTASKERMMELNETINWKPKSTGEGRFGKWLENLVDWNLSRSRYWGTPLPIWVTEDGKEMKCIGSVAELKTEIQKAIVAGFVQENPLKDFVENDMSKENYNSFDLHRPYVDNIILVSDSGKPMKRESDLIDVWFDSGAMPYAQQHYPFENKENFDKCFPADFIAEGVDQTRGWFFTLHAIATMLFDSVAFKNIISNGLVLDAKGNKMSKRLGNGVDPFETLDKYGADPVRWYMITNAQPWDNLKFDVAGIDEVRRKFFGTLYNTYSFFALYANIDGFKAADEQVPFEERPELDRWILSLLNTLVEEVTEHYDNYELTRAGRAIQHFVTENLSNWYVRLCRKRYWGGEYNTDKISAYQTLYECLKTLSILGSPIAPFYMDRLYRDLMKIQGVDESVHLTTFPKPNMEFVDKELEARMDLAQQISSMILSLRRKVQIKVRQPLQKVLIPILDQKVQERIEGVEDIILSEVNVKEIEYLTDASNILVKSIKPNFKTLGPKYGKMMKQIAGAIAKLTQEEIAAFEKNSKFDLEVETENLPLTLEDVEIVSEDIPGWLVANEGALTVALDITITDDLRNEGIARELVNRIQNIRKESGFDVTDKVNISISTHEVTDKAVNEYKHFIASQTLGNEVMLVANLQEGREQDIEDGVVLKIDVKKL